ncbi:MAG TPA: hypothetical protein VMI52_05310 [Acetobacteraceae bacterium]|nr:hypothetical protein [Acetobacteraceae bacterium]
MRRFALLTSTLLLAGCTGSGFWTFLGNSTTLPGANPNAPFGDAENMKRVRAQTVEMPALQPEAGNVWPGPPPPQPTLADIERQQNAEGFRLPPESAMPPMPGLEMKQGAPTPNAGPSLPRDLQVPPPVVTPPVPEAPVPPPSAYAPPAMPKAGLETGGKSRTQGGAIPKGSIVIPNGNGTSTVIGPDGSITTIPTPR